MPIASSVQAVGAWLDLQMARGKSRDDVPLSVYLCPMLIKDSRAFLLTTAHTMDCGRLHRSTYAKKKAPPATKWEGE